MEVTGLAHGKITESTAGLECLLQKEIALNVVIVKIAKTLRLHKITTGSLTIVVNRLSRRRNDALLNYSRLDHFLCYRIMQRAPDGVCDPIRIHSSAK